MRKRLFVYYKQTAPLIGYYYAKGCWPNWMATEPIDVVQAALRWPVEVMIQMFKRQGANLLRRQPASQTTAAAARPEPVLKSPREIQIMREAGRIVARVHAAMREAIRPGVSTWELDQRLWKSWQSTTPRLLSWATVAFRPISAPVSTKNWCMAFRAGSHPQGRRYHQYRHRRALSRFYR